MTGKTESLTIRLTPDAKLVLDELSRETGRPVSELVRQLVRHKYQSIGTIEFLTDPEPDNKEGKK